ARRPDRFPAAIFRRPHEPFSCGTADSADRMPALSFFIHARARPDDPKTAKNLRVNEFFVTFMPI
ncbi:MAG: hypothetical protein K2F92_07235, partial [Alistipes sp.]|nr:hypothetical protein [Alistipes sp.]